MTIPSNRIQVPVAVVALVLLAAGSSFAQGNGKPQKVGRTSPPANPLEKLDPWKRRTIDRGSPSDETRPPFTPRSVDAEAEIVLGQRVRGRLNERGDVGIVRFEAPAGTRLRFSIACEGGVGSSNVALLDSGGSALAEFAQHGRRFELANHVLTTSGTCFVRIVHDHVEPMSFVMSTSGEFPAAAKEVVDLRKEAAVTFFVEGFPGRSVAAAEVVPLAPRESVDVRLVLSDRLDEKLGSFEGHSRSASEPGIELEAPIDLFERERYRCDVWLLGGRSPQRVEVRLLFANPPAGTGTVELRKRS